MTKHTNISAVKCGGDNDTYEDGHDDDDNCINNINLYNDNDADVVGYIHLSTPRQDKN